MENNREMDLFQGSIAPNEVAARFMLLRSLALNASGRIGLGGIPELDHSHVFHWHVGHGVTVIECPAEEWLCEVGLLIESLASEDHIPFDVDPAPEILRDLVLGGDLPRASLPDVAPLRLRIMQEAGVLAPLSSPENRAATPVLIFTPGAWLSSQSHFIREVADLGARIVILCDDTKVADALPHGFVDRHLVIDGLRLNGWTFRKVLRTFLGDLAPHNDLYEESAMVGPTWVRQHITHLLQALPKM